jgi:hypothetical protein
MMIRTLVFTAAAAVFAGLLGLSSNTFAAPGGGNGPPDGGGQTPPVDFGDLFKLYRDVDGVPILTAGVPEDSTAQNATAGFCQQPLASAECVAAPPEGCTLEQPEPGVDVVPTIAETCAVVEACSSCTEEVDFGRINEARSSDTVFDEQLQDVVVNLATSDCVISLDPAGRMVTGTILATDPDSMLPTEWTSATLDSPLGGLAMYRQLLKTGSIGVPLPAGEGNPAALITAARGLGTASDKSGGVDVDTVAYINEIMGLTDPATETILGPRLYVDVREEVQGTVQTVRKYFLNYGAFGYDRGDNFTALPAPPYIDDPLGDEDMPGWFEYLSLYDLGPPELFQHTAGPILDAVFPDSPFVEFDGSNIGAFAQAADDTRAVIDYMHTWPVPADFATVVPCDAVSVGTYDVSISDVSGLQVPRNIVSGTEGREFTVTVANAGPDPATGTVTVTGTLANGTPIHDPWVFPFTDLQQGDSAAYTQLFSVTVDAATTIDWEATAEAPNDVFTGNNHVHATSNVTVTGRR